MFDISNIIFDGYFIQLIICTIFHFYSACQDKFANGYKPANCQGRYCPALARLSYCGKKWSQLRPVSCYKGMTNWWKNQFVRNSCKKSCNLCGMLIVSKNTLNFLQMYFLLLVFVFCKPLNYNYSRWSMDSLGSLHQLFKVMQRRRGYGRGTKTNQNM